MRVHALIAFALLVLLLSSCTPDRTEVVDYNKGTKGLEFEFIENNPPRKVYAGDTFPISIYVENLGSYSLIDSSKPSYSWAENENIFSSNHASVSLVYDDFYFVDVAPDIASQRENIFLAGKNRYFPEGENRIITLAMLKANALQGRKGAEEVIGVNLCYPYQNRLVERICIDADPYNQDKRVKLCSAEDMHYSQGQGGPVAITNIEVRSTTVGVSEEAFTVSEPVYDDEGYIVGWEELTEKVFASKVTPSVRILLRNVGDGVVVRAKEFGEQQLCGPNPEMPSGAVLLQARIGDAQLDCSFDGVVRLANNEAEVVCSLPVEQSFVVNSNYYATLQVELSYTYKTSDHIDIEIDDSLQSHDPILVFNQKCSDFTGSEQSCKSFGSGGYYGLECFWCPETETCLEGNCDGCGTNWAFEATRTCIDACPTNGQPQVTNSEPFNGAITLTCTDNSAVTDLNRVACGCDHFKYQFFENTPVCPPALVLADTASSRGYNPDGIIVSQLQIPSNIQQGAPGILCYVGASANGAHSNVQRVLFNAGSVEEIANGAAWYLLGMPLEDAAGELIN